MKPHLRFLMVLAALLLAQACAHREPLSAEDQQRVRMMINDRSTWVDPAMESFK
jgi:hypothetical protein